MRELLESIQHALNKIPNKKNVGKNGESSYELASKLDELLKEFEAPCRVCGVRTLRRKEGTDIPICIDCSH